MRLVLLAAAAAVVTAMAAPAFSQTASESAAIDEFKQGQASATAKTNDKTVQIMSDVITQDKLPKDWKHLPYFYRGQAERRLEKYTEALGDFDKTTGMQPTFDAAYFEAGMSYDSQKKWKQAIEQYDKAVKLQPGNFDYIYSRCVAKSWANDNAGARDDCKKATQLNPKSAEAWNTLGRAYEDLGQLDNAEDAYRQTLKINPKMADAQEGLDHIAECRKPQADCTGGGGQDSGKKKKGK